MLTPEERAQSSRPDPENQVDEPWYSKTWDWMNKPLYDAHQWGVRTGAGTIERGAESGVEDLISGLTSPLSVALTVGTLGGDTVANIGAQGLRAIGVSAEAAPFVTRGIKSLMDLGFTGQALSGLLTQSPQFLDALKDGDYENAARLGTSILANGTMTALGAGKTFEDAGVVKDAVSGKTASMVETLKTAKKIAGKVDEGNAVASDRAKTLAAGLQEDLKRENALDPITQGGIRKYIAANGDLKLLKDQHDALDGTLPVKQMSDAVTAVPNPSIKDFGSKANFDAYLAGQGTLDDLGKQFDVARYRDEAGKKVEVPLKPADQIPTKPAWNQDYVYYAADKTAADNIRNSGVGRLGKAVEYHASPEEAMDNAPLTPSGNKADLRVFAVPKDEAEAMEKNPVKDRKPIMPSHEIVVDGGKPLAQAVPLRPDSPFSLTRDNERFENQYSDAEKDKLLAQYKAAQNLTPGQIAIANKLRSFYEGEFNRANDAGVIRQAVEGYHPQAWAKDRPGFFQNLFGGSVDPTDNSAFNNLRHQTDNGAFDTSVNAAKHRAFETEFQGEMAGYKNKTDDLAYHAANYQNHLDRAITARQYLDDMRASGAKASDGRPIVALQGSSKIVGAESGNPALLVDPQSKRGIAISQDIIKSMMERGELEDLVNSGKIEKLPYDTEVKNDNGEIAKLPGYAWSTDGYQTIDHPSMRDWQYLGKDTGGNNAMLKAQMRVHPEAADYIRQVVGANKSVFRENPYLRTMMAAQRETKGALLSFSPFHAVQEGLRGVMLGINPLKDASGNWLKWSPVHIENDPLLKLGVRNNLTFPDYKAEDMFSEGVATQSKLIGKIPGLNKIQNYIQDFTFDKLIPNLKARAFKSVYQRFQDRMPGALPDEVAHEAATYVNDAFGGQHWRDLGISATAQDVSRLAALAPDWLTSEARMLYRAAGGMGSPAATVARQDMLRLTASLYMTARVVNMLSNGSPHPEAPFGLVVPGKNGQDDKVYSLRTLPTDLVHAMTDPRGFLAGRVNPLMVRPAVEFITGRNDRGQKVSGADQFEDAARNFIPIGAQGFLTGNVPGNATSADQLAKAAGATVYSYHTEAENLAQIKASDHMPSGKVDPDELAKHQRNIKLEDGLRAGEVSRGEIRRLLPAREASTIIENAQMTGLQARFNRLPMKDALDVWALATPSEKDQLHKLLWKKRVAYIQSHTAAERATDPTWRKLQGAYADLQRR